MTLLGRFPLVFITKLYENNTAICIKPNRVSQTTEVLLVLSGETAADKWGNNKDQHTQHDFNEV